MTVWICQCLCPAGHCLVGAADVAETRAEANRLVRVPLRRQLAAAIKSGDFQAECTLCDAKPATWRYELRRTRFATMAEAMPALRQAQAEAENHAMNLLRSARRVG